MTQPSRYRLSLHVSHPALSAPDVIKHFVIPVRYARSVGEQRTTPTGTKLGGTYSETDVSFDVSQGVLSDDEIPFVDCIIDSLGKLPANEINEFISTGGECYYLAGIYTEDNILFYLPSKFLAALSSLAIGLKLDIYGGEE